MSKFVAYKFVSFRCEVEADNTDDAVDKAEKKLKKFNEKNYHNISPVVIIENKDLTDDPENEYFEALMLQSDETMLQEKLKKNTN